MLRRVELRTSSGKLVLRSVESEFNSEATNPSPQGVKKP
jgi:hypothetical protein